MEQALPLEPLQGLRVPGETPLSDILLGIVFIPFCADKDASRIFEAMGVVCTDYVIV